MAEGQGQILSRGICTRCDEPRRTGHSLLHHATPHPTEGPLPPILPAVSRLKDTIHTQNGPPELDTSLGEQQRTAFLILVYLHLYRSLLTPIIPGQDIRVVWTSAVASTNKANETETRLLEVWTTYLDTQSPSLSEVQSLLWSEFPLEHGSTRYTKVIDCLYSEHIPPAFLVHPVIQTTMMATWKVGLRYRDDGERYHMWQRFDALTSPRVMHFLHLLGHLLFVGTLAHYLLYPPPFIVFFDYPRYTSREIFLVVMAASSLFAPWTLHSLSYIQVFLAFVLTLPSEPLPGWLAFTFLHIALMVHMVSLHLPHPPSIAYLLYPSTGVSLSSLLMQCAIRFLLPIIALFLPAVFFTTYLASASLADSPLYHFSVINLVPTDTRTSFLLLFLVVFAFIFSVISSFSTADMSFATSAEPWDRYTPVVGRPARRMFYHAVARYTGYVFFPPFNVLLLIVIIPSFFRFLLGYRGSHAFKEVKVFMWRLSVGVLGAAVGGIWLWGLI